MVGFVPPGSDAAVFVISIAADLSGLHPQTLRTYDRLGIVRPGRTPGGGRRYSLDDIALLRDVARLTSEGLGLEGVRRVLALEREVLVLRARVAELEGDLEGRAQTHPRTPNLPVPLSQAAQQVVLWRRRR